MEIFSGFLGPWTARNHKMLDAIVDFPAENRPSHPPSYSDRLGRNGQVPPLPVHLGRVNDPAYCETRLGKAYNHQQPYISWTNVMIGCRKCNGRWVLLDTLRCIPLTVRSSHQKQSDDESKTVLSRTLFIILRVSCLGCFHLSQDDCRFQLRSFDMRPNVYSI